MSKKIEKWVFWIRVFGPLMRQAPEFFPLLGRLCSMEIPVNSMSVDQPRAESISDHKWSWIRPINSPTSTFNDAPVVLFDPQTARPNCLGACRKIAENLDNNQCLFLRHSRYPLPYNESETVVEFKDNLVFFNIGRTFVLLSIFLRRLQKIGVPMFSFIALNLFALIKSVVIVQCRIKRARKILREHNVSWVVTPNEHGVLSMSFIVAAKIEGICCGQYLHGIPTRLYHPFFSDIFWVAGETTHQMLQGPTWRHASKLIPIGSMEFPEGIRIVGTDVVSESHKRSTKRLLFLSQLVGDHVWETDAFEQVLSLLAEALSEVQGWFVCVRLHPTAGRPERKQVREMFEQYQLSYEFSNEECLSKDVSRSDFVCTGSSTAVLEALLQLKPLCLIWNEGLSHVHGSPFLDNEFVVRDVQEMRTRLKVAVSDIDSARYQGAIDRLVGRPGAPARIATHINESFTLS